MITHALQPQVNTTDEPPLYFLGLPTFLRATSETTNGAFGLVENLMPAGFVSPYHTHRLEDEAFYVLEGEMAFVCGGNWIRAKAGTYVFGPRNIPHGFKVLGNAPARMLLLCAPAGFAQFVADMAEAAPAPPDMAKLMAVAAKYQVEILGPLPEGPQGFIDQNSPARDPKSVTRRWIQAFNERDWTTERAMRSLDFRGHVSGTPDAFDADGWSSFMVAFSSAFPDARISIDSCIAEGDSATARWSMTGTHQGEFQGIPATGRVVTFSGIECNRVLDGQVVEHWAVLDNVALLQQLGVLPA